MTRHSAASVAMLIVLATTSASAQDMSEADLVGRYAFSVSVEGQGELQNGGQPNRGYHQLLGSFVLDGTGGVTEGSRKFFRSVLKESVTGLGVDFSDQITDLVEQTFTGSYSVTPDGAGTMTLSVMPPSEMPWLLDPRGRALEASWILESPETLHFNAADGGRVLKIVLVMEGERDVDVPGRPDQPDAKASWRFLGEAESLAPTCEDDSVAPCELANLLIAPVLPGGVLPSSHPCFIEEEEDDESTATPRLSRRSGRLR